MRRTLSAIVVAASLPLAAAAAAEVQERRRRGPRRRAGHGWPQADHRVDRRRLRAARQRRRPDARLRRCSKRCRLSVIFVLDTSGSVAGSKMWNLNAAVDLLLNGLHDADRAALVTFSHRVWLRTPLIADFHELRTLLASAEAQGGTALYDAVYAALAISDVQDSRPLARRLQRRPRQHELDERRAGRKSGAARQRGRLRRRGRGVDQDGNASAGEPRDGAGPQARLSERTDRVPRSPRDDDRRPRDQGRHDRATCRRPSTRSCASSARATSSPTRRAASTRPAGTRSTVKVKGRPADVRARTGYQK